MTTSSREGQYFDRLIEQDGDFNPFADDGWVTLERRFRAASGGTAFARMLEIGCGTGSSRRIYARQVAAYAGLDLSREALRTAARRNPGLSWLQADGAQLPFAAHSFDLVAFSSVLHHLPDLRPVLADARRVMKPGGFVFAFDPNLLHPAMMLFRHPRSPLYSSRGVSPTEQPLMPVKLRVAFEEAGFTDIGQRCQSDIAYRQVAPTALQRLLAFYNVVDRLWERCGMGRWFGSFVVTWARAPK